MRIIDVPWGKFFRINGDPSICVKTDSGNMLTFGKLSFGCYDNDVCFFIEDGHVVAEETEVTRVSDELIKFYIYFLWQLWGVGSSE